MCLRCLPAATAGRHASQMAEVVSSVADIAGTRMSTQPPALPSQKQVDVPDVEVVGNLCCPPEPVLLEHFRVQRQQVLEVSLVL